MNGSKSSDGQIDQIVNELRRRMENDTPLEPGAVLRQVIREEISFMVNSSKHEQLIPPPRRIRPFGSSNGGIPENAFDDIEPQAFNEPYFGNGDVDWMTKQGIYDNSLDAAVSKALAIYREGFEFRAFSDSRRANPVDDIHTVLEAWIIVEKVDPSDKQKRRPNLAALAMTFTLVVVVSFALWLISRVM